jgi:hypothetical protein
MMRIGPIRLWDRGEESLDDGTVVLRKLFLIAAPGFFVLLNRILVAEGQKYRHDHASWYVSVVLRGGYVEALDDLSFDPLGGHIRRVRRHPGSLAFRRAREKHYIAQVNPGCKTLMIGGRRSHCSRWYPLGEPPGAFHFPDERIGAPLPEEGGA